MPQVAIEYSGNLSGLFDARGFAQRVHALLAEHAEAAIPNCKTRLLRLDDWLIGDGAAAHAMVHVDLRILPGRTAEQKQALGAAVLADLRAAVLAADGFDLQLTVEVRELDGANYHKARLPESRP